MKNKTLSVFAILAVLILFVALIAGFSTSNIGKTVDDPSHEGSEDVTSDKDPSHEGSEDVTPDKDPSLDGSEESSTNNGSSGGNSPTPGYMLRFEESDALTTTVLASAKNAAWTYDESDSLWNYSEGSLYRVAIPDSFVFPDDDIIVRMDSSLSSRLYDMAWHVGNGSIPLNHFNGHITFKKTDSSQISVDDVKSGVHFYTRTEIVNNLGNKYLTDEYLNYLIDLLVCQGIYTESSINRMMFWQDEDASNTSSDYFGNRICMRYPVRVFSDVKVTFSSDEYEYVLYIFEDIDSMVSTSSVGWTVADGEFVIPKGTAFCIGIRPVGLTTDQSGMYGEDRGEFGYVYTDDWDDIVSFEIVK